MKVKTSRDNQKLTSAQRELLTRYHNAVRDIPSTEDIIKAFDLPTTKQNIVYHAKKARGGENEK